MKALRLLLGLLIMSYSCMFISKPVRAESPDIVIAQVQAGSSAAASQEYVSIYNNSSEDINVTGWCLRYNGSNAKPGCMKSTDPQTRLILAAHSYTTFASSEFIAAHDGFIPQARTGFSGGMSDAAGSLTLVDATGLLHDQFTWSAKAAPGMIYQRLSQDQTTFKDTNIDVADFMQTALHIPETLGLYEQAIALDVCPNIVGIQPSLPPGFMQDAAGDCWPDMCVNLAGLQITTPDGYESGDDHVCTLVPPENARLIVTELLPNTAGSDTGKEFIEVYNPNDRPVPLMGYQIQLGPMFSKSYTFISGALGAQSYQAFSDTVTGLVLPNTTASVRIVAPDGTIVSTTAVYDNPPEDGSWSLITDEWQFTSTPTPASANIANDPMLDVDNISKAPAACAAGKYRNPETNRCKNIESIMTTTPCNEDEYRSAETNCCRKLTLLAASRLAPCKPGQERNTETNRCRLIATTEPALQPCGSGEERNPETNRCKKSPTSSIGANQNKEPEQNAARPNPLVLLSVFGLTAGYGIYEYRYDVANLYIRVKRRLLSRRAIGAK